MMIWSRKFYTQYRHTLLALRPSLYALHHEWHWLVPLYTIKPISVPLHNSVFYFNCAIRPRPWCYILKTLRPSFYSPHSVPVCTLYNKERQNLYHRYLFGHPDEHQQYFWHPEHRSLLSISMINKTLHSVSLLGSSLPYANIRWIELHYPDLLQIKLLSPMDRPLWIWQIGKEYRTVLNFKVRVAPNLERSHLYQSGVFATRLNVAVACCRVIASVRNPTRLCKVTMPMRSVCGYASVARAPEKLFWRRLVDSAVCSAGTKQ